MPDERHENRRPRGRTGEGRAMGLGLADGTGTWRAGTGTRPGGMRFPPPPIWQGTPRERAGSRLETSRSGISGARNRADARTTGPTRRPFGRTSVNGPRVTLDLVKSRERQFVNVLGTPLEWGILPPIWYAGSSMQFKLVLYTQFLCSTLETSELDVETVEGAFSL